jgi:hypothetical protein
LHDITSTFSCSTLILVLRWTRFADYVASNKRVIREWWIWKDLEGRGRSLILRYYPGIHLEGLRKTTKTLVRIPGLRAEVWTLVLTNTKSVTTRQRRLVANEKYRTKSVYTAEQIFWNDWKQLFLFSRVLMKSRQTRNWFLL